MRYAIGQWPAIGRYTTVAEAEVDNNSCESTIRTPVLGRKNWLFAGSVEGGRRGAQVINTDNGHCWESALSHVSTKKATDFKARAD